MASMSADGNVTTEGTDLEKSVNGRHEAHPSYTYLDADIVLVSDDGIRFRVHSAILKHGSEFFRTMLGIPQVPAEDRKPDKDEPIRISESSEILVDLLNIIYPGGDPLPHILTFKHLSDLFAAAEKYDMAKVKALVRKIILPPEMGAKNNPLELYVLACRFGWDLEKKLALSWSLDVSLHSPSSLSILAKLETAKDLLLLQDYHRRRREFLQDIFKNTIVTFVNEGNFGQCPRSNTIHRLDSSLGQGHFEYVTWCSLHSCASGAQLATEAFWANANEDSLRTFKCPTCQKPMIDSGKLAAAFQKILKTTPAPETLVE